MEGWKFDTGKCNFQYIHVKHIIPVTFLSSYIYFSLYVYFEMAIDIHVRVRLKQNIYCISLYTKYLKL